MMVEGGNGEERWVMVEGENGEERWGDGGRMEWGGDGQEVWIGEGCGNGDTHTLAPHQCPLCTTPHLLAPLSPLLSPWAWHPVPPACCHSPPHSPPPLRLQGALLQLPPMRLMMEPSSGKWCRRCPQILSREASQPTIYPSLHPLCRPKKWGEEQGLF